MAGPGSRSTQDERGLWFARALTALYLTLIVHVSLVPAAFGVSRRHFVRHLVWMVLSVHPYVLSRMTLHGLADVVANLLLYLPLGLLWPWTEREPRRSWIWVGVPLSLMLEVLQAATWDRTASLLDVVANGCGFAAGYVIASRLIRERGLSHSLFVGGEGPDSLAHRAGALRSAYLTALLVLSLFPYDVTVSAERLWSKALGDGSEPGRIQLFLLTPWDESRVTGLLLALGLAVVFGFLSWLVTRGSVGLGRLAVQGLVVVCVIEAGQVFVASRTADVAQVFVGGLGASLGGWLARLCTRGAPPEPPARDRDRARTLLLAAALLWTLVLWTEASTPFAIVSTWKDAARELVFHTYWLPLSGYGGPHRSPADWQDLAREVGLYVPMGLFLGAWSDRGQPRRPWTRRRLLPALGIAALGAVLELSQCMIAGRTVDVTDALSHALGGFIGLGLASLVSAALSPCASACRGHPGSAALSARSVPAAARAIAQRVDALRLADVALLVASLALVAAGSFGWAVGGGRWRAGPLTLSLQQPLRTVGLGLGLLLLRDGLRSVRVPVPWWRSALLVAALAGALAADAPRRLVGDGQEYLAMAVNLASGRAPSLTDPERAAIEARFGLGGGALRFEPLVGADGRQDCVHFWLFSLVAAPLVRVASAWGVSPLAGFAVTNVLLLAAAAGLVQRRAGAAAVPVLFAGPLLWWADKPHPEVLFVSLLAAALALAPDRPQWALPLVGVAAAQNPVFLPVLAVGTAWAWLRRRPRPAFLLGATAIAWALAAAGPLYSLHRLGRATPLEDTVLPHVPGLAELSAVLVDPNLGLLPAWPSMGVLALIGMVLAARAIGRRAAESWDAAALALAIAALVVLFTQPGNINHGGTPGMSRYAVWLAAFAVPVLAQLGTRAGGAAPLVLTALGALSVASAFPAYVPARSERYLEPTPLARWLWTRHPGLDHPLPEVFAERAWGYPPLGTAPASTPECEKALLRGDGTAVGPWPLACSPAEKPEACRPQGALCYADLTPAGYRFVPAPAQPTYRDAGRKRWYWSGAPTAALTGELRALRWAEMGIVDPRDEGVFLLDRRGAGRVQLRTAPGAWLAWLDGARQADAWLVPRVRYRARALLVDPLRGQELSRTPLVPELSTRIALPWRAPLLLVVVDQP